MGRFNLVMVLWIVLRTYFYEGSFFGCLFCLLRFEVDTLTLQFRKSIKFSYELLYSDAIFFSVMSMLILRYELLMKVLYSTSMSLGNKNSTIMRNFLKIRTEMNIHYFQFF